MKKNIFITLFAILLAAQGMAQDSTRAPFTQQLTVGIHNGSGLLIYKRGVQKEWSIRYRIGGSYTYDNTGGNVELEATRRERHNRYEKRLVSSVGIGKQKNNHISGVNIFYGADLFATVSRLERVQTVEYLDGHLYRWEGDYDEVVRLDQNTLTLSFRPIIGITIPVKERFSIGVERNFDLLSAGHTFSEKYTVNTVELGESSTMESSTAPVNSFSFGLSGSTTITASVFF